MKKVCMFALAGVVSVLFSGCFSTHTNDLAKDTTVNLKADYEMVIKTGDKKVSGSASQNVLFNFISWGDSKFADRAFCSDNAGFSLFPNPITLVKQAATYNACQAAKCDMLIGAKYTVEVKDFVVFKQVSCTATGYPGVEMGIKAAK